jgi:endonuclease YncB( thermonuclease family)
MSDPKETFRQYGGASTPEFSLNNMRTYARVISCYDGDSIGLVIPVFNTFYKFKIRIMGIDTCEMKSKNKANKDLAVKARNRLLELITKQHIDPLVINTKKHIDHLLSNEVYLVYVHCFEFEKFGRVLAHIYEHETSTQSYADVLVEEKLAYRYTGDTKLTEEQQVALLTRL